MSRNTFFLRYLSLAVVLLLLGVVVAPLIHAPQHTETSQNGVSPLFSVRINNVKHKESESIVTEYIGKSKPEPLSFPSRNRLTDLLYKLKNKLRNINDEAYMQIVDKAIHHFMDSQINRQDASMVKNVLLKIKENPEYLMMYAEKDDNKATIFNPETPCWFPGYNIIIFLMLVIWGILTITVLYISAYLTCFFTMSEIK